MIGGWGGGGAGGKAKVKGVGSDEGMDDGLGKVSTRVGWWRMESNSARGVRS